MTTGSTAPPSCSSAPLNAGEFSSESRIPMAKPLFDQVRSVGRFRLLLIRPVKPRVRRPMPHGSAPRHGHLPGHSTSGARGLRSAAGGASSACDFNFAAFSTRTAANCGFPVRAANRSRAVAWSARYRLPIIVKPLAGTPLAEGIKHQQRNRSAAMHKMYPPVMDESARSMKARLRENSLVAYTVSNFSMTDVSANPALVHSSKAGNAIIVSM